MPMAMPVRVRPRAGVPRRSSTSRPSYGLFIDGEFVDGRSGSAVQDHQPGHRGGPRRGHRRRAPPTSTAPSPPPAAPTTRVWGRMPRRRPRQVPLPHRPHPAGARPRVRRAGDARQRQADQGDAATSTCRWRRRTSSTTRAGPTSSSTPASAPNPRPLGVVGQVIPWNFPLLMLAWKIAPGAGRRQHRRPQAGRDHAADRAAVRRGRASRPTCRRASSTSSPAPARPGSASSTTRTSTRSRSPARPRSASRSPARSPAPARRPPSSSAARRPTSSSTTPPIDQAVEGIVNGIFFNQGHVCCAGSRLLVQENIADDVERRLKRRLADAARRRPARQEHRRRRDQLRARSWTRIRELTDAGEAEGAERWDRACELPDHGLLVPRRRCSPASRQTHRIAQEEIFGPVLSVLTFRTPQEAVAKANNTPYGLSAGIWTEKGSRILWMADQLRAGVVWANTFNRFDPTSPVRRLQGVRLRPRGRPPRPRRPTSRQEQADEPRPRTAPDARVDVRKTYKLYIGGDVPAQRVRPLLRGRPTAAGTFLANAAQGSRKDARDAVVAARGAFARLGRRHGVQPRPGALPRRRGDGGPARPVRRRGRAPREGVPARRAEALVDAGDRPLGLVRRVDRQARPGARRAQPRRRARTSTSRRPSRPASSPSWRRRQSSLLGLVSVARAGRRRGNTAVVLASERAPAARRHALARCWPPPTSRAAWSTSSPAAPPRSRPWLASHRDVNAIDLAGAADAEGVDWGDLERAAADNLKRVLRPAGEGTDAVEPDWTRHPRPVADARRSSRPRPSGTPRAAEGRPAAEPAASGGWAQGSRWRSRNSNTMAHIRARCALSAAAPWPPSMFS